MKRLSIFAVALAAFFGSVVPRSAAQELSELGDAEARGGHTVSLAFSKNGRTLRELRMVRGAGWYGHTRAVNRDTKTGKISKVFDLEPNTAFFSRTSDGHIVVISENRGQQDQPVRLFLFDTDTGSAQEIPADWFDSGDHNPIAMISGNGRLVSAFAQSGPADAPLVVSVYDWRTKKRIARQMRGLHAGGFEDGGITEDGRIEFSNNRSGTDIVDPKTGRRLVSFEPNAARSADGKWIVELPGYLHGYEREDSVILDGADGKKLGALEGLTLPEMADSWTGVFCGTTGKLVVWKADAVLAFQVPSGKRIATISSETWQDKNPQEDSGFRPVSVACSWNGKRIAIRSGARLTLRELN